MIIAFIAGFVFAYALAVLFEYGSERKSTHAFQASALFSRARDFRSAIRTVFMPFSLRSIGSIFK